MVKGVNVPERGVFCNAITGVTPFLRDGQGASAQR